MLDWRHFNVATFSESHQRAQYGMQRVSLMLPSHLQLLNSLQIQFFTKSIKTPKSAADNFVRRIDEIDIPQYKVLKNIKTLKTIPIRMPVSSGADGSVINKQVKQICDIDFITDLHLKSLKAGCGGQDVPVNNQGTNKSFLSTLHLLA